MAAKELADQIVDVLVPLAVDRPYSYRLREAVKTGEAVVRTGLPKIIWLYEISDKLKRKNKIVRDINS